MAGNRHRADARLRNLRGHVSQANQAAATQQDLMCQLAVCACLPFLSVRERPLLQAFSDQCGPSARNICSGWFPLSACQKKPVPPCMSPSDPAEAGDRLSASFGEERLLGLLYLSGKQGKREGEGRALPFHTFHPQFSLIVMNDLVRDEQPDAQPGGISALLTAGPIESLKNFLLLVFRNADAEILDADGEALGTLGETDDDLRCLWGVFHSIGQ